MRTFERLIPNKADGNKTKKRSEKNNTNDEFLYTKKQKQDGYDDDVGQNKEKDLGEGGKSLSLCGEFCDVIAGHVGQLFTQRGGGVNLGKGIDYHSVLI